MYMNRTQLIVVGAVGLIVFVSISVLVWLFINRDTRSRDRGSMETIQFQTQDGVTIVGDVYRPASSPKGGVLLLHMMPADRTSWQDFGARLAEAGYLGLAIDLRGHGESTQQGTTSLNYQTFSDPEHQQSQLDVQAGVKWLTDQGIELHRLGVVGASIGANLALVELTSSPEIRWAVLLSPGLEYKGIATAPLTLKLRPTQRVLLVASDDDPYSFQTILELANLSPAQTTVRKLSGVGHGTTMWENLLTEIEATLSWIESGQPNG